MTGKLKMIVGLVATVVLIGVWLVTATFTGAEMGQPCNGDGDCRGLSAACVAGSDNQKYCTQTCKDASGCPAGWVCSSVSVTNIDGSGNMTEGGSTTLCTLQGR